MSPPEPGGSRTRLDDPDELLDARSDPAATAFGTSGSEAGSELNWIALLAVVGEDPNVDVLPLPSLHVAQALQTREAAIGRN